MEKSLCKTLQQFLKKKKKEKKEIKHTPTIQQSYSLLRIYSREKIRALKDRIVSAYDIFIHDSA